MLLGLLAPELLGETTSFLREAANEDPAEAIVWTVLVSAQLFFKADEKDDPEL